MVAHVPVAVPAAERSEWISVRERISDLLASTAAFVCAVVSVVLAIAVVLRVVVVVAG